MAKSLADLRPTFVIGAGWHPFQNPSDTHYSVLGLTAIRGALGDAGIPWSEVEQTFVGTALLGMASGRPMLKHLGALGQPVVHIENASASGSAAFHLACAQVAGGLSDVVLVLGVDKRPAGGGAARAPAYQASIADHAIAPVTHFALLADEYLHANGVSPEDVARIAVKNHGNGALNPNAQRQKARSLEEVLNSRFIAGSLTALQCCPVGEGAAAVIVASEDAIRRLGVAGDKPVRIAAGAAASERFDGSDREITTEVIKRALFQSSIEAAQIDIFETHDAFAIEEAFYAEAAGLCPAGHYTKLLQEGAFDIGGKCAVSPSGGLLAMGHPIGPTGVGQIGEITLQLRGQAGPRQHQGAQVGVASMVGLGAVGYAHVLVRP